MYGISAINAFLQKKNGHFDLGSYYYYSVKFNTGVAVSFADAIPTTETTTNKRAL